MMKIRSRLAETLCEMYTFPSERDMTRIDAFVTSMTPKQVEQEIRRMFRDAPPDELEGALLYAKNVAQERGVAA